ncbi:hypothetical protein, partial [Streptomyces lavenduligriseus]|uniref:hypothetical protein n=1 Tax=Streptomyces lavenduligriseus TaxID=67315 RepID=UPI0012FF02DB
MEHRRLQDWRYRVEWKPFPAALDEVLGGGWLFVVPRGLADDGVVARVVAAVTARGGEVSVVELDPTRPDRRAYAEAVAGRGVSGVVSFLSWDDRRHSEHPVVPAGLAASLVLAQALVDLGRVGEGPRLWLVTR